MIMHSSFNYTSITIPTQNIFFQTILNYHFKIFTFSNACTNTELCLPFVHVRRHMKRHMTIFVNIPPLYVYNSIYVPFHFKPRFVVSFIYYGLTMNVDSLGGNIYENFALLVLVELFGYSAIFFLNLTGRKPMHLASIFGCGVASIGSILLILFAENSASFLFFSFFRNLLTLYCYIHWCRAYNKLLLCKFHSSLQTDVMTLFNVVTSRFSLIFFTVQFT